MTPAQKKYAQIQRSLLGLRRAAVRHTNAVDRDSGAAIETVTALEAAAFGYCHMLSTRERRRLS